MAARRKRGFGRPVPPPDGGEGFEVRTADDVLLRGTVREPVGRPVGTVILAHAMFARRSAFERPAGAGLAPFLAARGFRTVAFDFRGHGESGRAARAGGDWSYDDLVRFDLPAVVESVRARARRGKVLLFGHSLGAHVALASHAVGACRIDGLAMLAGNVWLRELEPSPLYWGAKRAMLEAFERSTRALGTFPARALKLGSDDEAATYVLDLCRFGRTGAWRSADGKDDYLAALARVTIPVVSVASDGDRLNCRPESARRFLDLCAGPKRFERVMRADDGGPPPDHAGVLVGGTCTSAWERAVSFLADELRIALRRAS
jgi:alpha-beta hydrolase superfamily lysophospholipase